MKYPEFLKKGDKIVLTALSAGVNKKDLDKKNKYLKAISNLENEKFNVEMQEHCLFGLENHFCQFQQFLRPLLLQHPA